MRVMGNVVRSTWVAALVTACGPSVDGPAQDGGASGSAADASGGGEGAEGDGNPYVGCIATQFGNPQLLKCHGAFGVTVQDACAACACHDADCDRDSDCPSPSNSTAECRDGACVLRCDDDDDDDCPPEMRCGSLNADESMVCAEALAEPLACAAGSSEPGWPDPCVELTDKASCEAITSELGYACKWATFSLYQVPSNECLPVEVTESCIMTRSEIGGVVTPGVCAPFGLCSATGTRVFFEDIGAGTVRLISYDECELQLSPLFGTAGPIEYCDYSGTTPLPIICGCACP